MKKVTNLQVYNAIGGVIHRDVDASSRSFSLVYSYSDNPQNAQLKNITIQSAYDSVTADEVESIAKFAEVEYSYITLTKSDVLRGTNSSVIIYPNKPKPFFGGMWSRDHANNENKNTISDNSDDSDNESVEKTADKIANNISKSIQQKTKKHPISRGQRVTFTQNDIDQIREYMETHPNNVPDFTKNTPKAVKKLTNYINSILGQRNFSRAEVEQMRNILLQ